MPNKNTRLYYLCHNIHYCCTMLLLCYYHTEHPMFQPKNATPLHKTTRLDCGEYCSNVSDGLTDASISCPCCYYYHYQAEIFVIFKCTSLLLSEYDDYYHHATKSIDYVTLFIIVKR